jgi:hypothetical protein
VSHFHSLDGNIRIEAMHKSNEAQPTTIKFIACKMEILLDYDYFTIQSFLYSLFIEEYESRLYIYIEQSL